MQEDTAKVEDQIKIEESTELSIESTDTLETEKETHNIPLKTQEATLASAPTLLEPPKMLNFVYTVKKSEDKKIFLVFRSHSESSKETNIGSFPSQKEAENFKKELVSLDVSYNAIKLEAYQNKVKALSLGIPLSELPQDPIFELPFFALNAPDKKARLYLGDARIFKSSRKNSLDEAKQTFKIAKAQKISEAQTALEVYKAALATKSPPHIAAPIFQQKTITIGKQKRQDVVVSIALETGLTEIHGPFPGRAESEAYRNLLAEYHASVHSYKQSIFDMQKEALNQGIAIDQLPPVPKLKNRSFRLVHKHGKVKLLIDGSERNIWEGKKAFSDGEDAFIAELSADNFHNKVAVQNYANTLNSITPEPIKYEYSYSPVREIKETILLYVKPEKPHGVIFYFWRSVKEKKRQFTNWLNEVGVISVQAEYRVPLYDVKPSSNPTYSGPEEYRPPIAAVPSPAAVIPKPSHSLPTTAPTWELLQQYRIEQMLNVSPAPLSQNHQGTSQSIEPRYNPPKLNENSSLETAINRDRMRSILPPPLFSYLREKSPAYIPANPTLKYAGIAPSSDFKVEKLAGNSGNTFLFLEKDLFSSPEEKSGNLFIINGDFFKSIPKGMGKTALGIIKLLVPEMAGVPGAENTHEQLNLIARNLGKKYDKLVHLQNPDSMASNAGKIVGELVGLGPITKVISVAKLPALTSSIAEGAIMGAILAKADDRRATTGAAVGGAIGGATHKVIALIRGPAAISHSLTPEKSLAFAESSVSKSALTTKTSLVKQFEKELRSLEKASRPASKANLSKTSLPREVDPRIQKALHEVKYLKTHTTVTDQQIKRVVAERIGLSELEIGNLLRQPSLKATQSTISVERTVLRQMQGDSSQVLGEFRNLGNSSLRAADTASEKIGSFNIEQLLDAGSAYDRAGFTRAGRGLMKHGYRENSLFPKPLGNPTKINKEGKIILNEILTNPNKTIIIDDIGGIEIYAPNGRGAEFRKDGTFKGFIEYGYK